MAAGETKVFVKAGRYFEIVDSSAAVTLAFYDKSGTQCDDATAVLSGFYFSESYAQFDIYSATAQTVEIFISSSAAGSKRQPGNVRVIDQSVDKTGSGNQYMQSVSQGASAGVVSLVNVAANGKTLAIKRLQFSSSVAGPVNIIYGTGVGTANATATAMRNKKVGSSSSTSQLGIGYTAALLPTAGEMPGANYWTFANVQANTAVELPLTTPIVISGTQFVGVSATVVNRDISVTVDCEEVA